jgi:imidazolonepropionase-like amidohydrolase
MLDVIAALHAADVQLLAGTDALAGFALHSEMNLYADAGIPPMDVLGIATLESARVMGADNEVGAVEPGLRADLILVDGRPDKDMSQIRRVTWVMRDGVAYDPAVLRELISIAPLASVSHAPDGADELVVMTGTGP